MAWFNNPSVWLVIIGVLVVIGVMIFGMIPKQKEQSKPVVAGTVSETSGDANEEFIIDGETQLSDIDLQEDEDFGMYQSSLSSWLSHRPSGRSVDRYTRHGKQQIQNVSSINTAMPPSLSDYIPYNTETTRLQEDEQVTVLE